MSRLTLVLLLFAFGAFANEPAPAPRVVDHCDGFDVTFESASGDAMEDDMTVTITFDKTAVSVPIERALFTPRRPLSTIKNRCTALTALDAGPDRALLLFAINGRPQSDGLAAVLLDTRKHRVLDVRNDLGDIRTENDLLVLRRNDPTSFDVRLIHDYLEDAICDCADAAIEEWKRVSVRGDKLEAGWVK